MSVDAAQCACGRCQQPIKVAEAEICWYCLRYLCYECWDEFGHCGHPEAEAINDRARKQHEGQRHD